MRFVLLRLWDNQFKGCLNARFVLREWRLFCGLLGAYDAFILQSRSGSRTNCHPEHPS